MSPLHRVSLSPRWILALCAALLLWRLNYAPLWNPDEGRYAAASLEMARPFDGAAPDWVVPHLNTVPRLNKPPLVYWLAAASFRIFGPSEWTGRLVPALAAIAVMLLVWAMARSMFGERAGLISALVWATSIFPFAMARTLNTDMLLTAAMTLALYGIYSMQKEKGKGKKVGPHSSFIIHHSSFIIAGAGMGLALLAKGPVGMALPLAVGFVFLGAARRWRGVPWRDALLAGALAVAVAAPWYLAVAAREPQFLQKFLLGENLNRFSGRGDFHDPTPFWFYAPIVLLGLMPWTPLLPLAFARLRLAEESLSGRRARRALWLLAGLLLLIFLPRFGAEPQLISLETQRFYLRFFNLLVPLALFAPLLARLRLRNESAGDDGLGDDGLSEEAAREKRDALCFLWLWAAFLIGLFSLSGTKLISYALPAFPALAMLLGQAIDGLFERAGDTTPTGDTTSAGDATSAGDVAPAARASPDAAARFALVATLFLNAVLAVAALKFLTDGKTLPPGEARPYVVFCAAVLASGSALAVWAWRSRDVWSVWRVVGAQAATALALYGGLLGLAGRLARYEDASPMFMALRPHLRPTDRFVQYKMSPQFTAVFYLRRPVEFVDFVNNSGLDEEAVAASKLFLRGERGAAGQLFAGPQRVFLLARRRHKLPLPPPSHLVARNNDYQIFSNRPPPAGLRYDFTAPGKR